MKLTHQLVAYWQFLVQSTNQHGVHSPFVFKWITRCLYDKQKPNDYALLDAYAAKLASDSSQLAVSDFGAGSRVFQSNLRRVNQMAKHAGSTRKRAQLLYRCAKYFSPDVILELGTSLGKGTQALALGAPQAKVHSVEGCLAIANYTRSQLAHLPNINIVNATFDTYFQEVFSSETLEKSSLVFIDGHHQGDALLRYAKALLPYVNEDTVWILDDIHWSKDMEAAWEEIKSWEKVPVTVDTFRWGFVFFRYGQAEEHFVVRP